MTTTQTRQELKVCAQTFASLASLGILIHFLHEMVSLNDGFPVALVLVGVTALGATLAVTAAWYRLHPTARRILAVLLGAMWALVSSEHLVDATGSALDVTGVLTFAGGLTLVFAAYWDRHRPLERAR